MIVKYLAKHDISQYLFLVHYPLILARFEGVFNKMSDNHFFNEALSNFSKDFAYGGAIRHLLDRGYTVDRIIKEFDYPVSREFIEKTYSDYVRNHTSQE